MSKFYDCPACKGDSTPLFQCLVCNGREVISEEQKEQFDREWEQFLSEQTEEIICRDAERAVEITAFVGRW